MANCKFYEACPFFEDKMPGTQKMYKDMFCAEKFDGCARYQVRTKLGKEEVPIDLYPHQFAAAEEIVEQKGKA